MSIPHLNETTLRRQAIAKSFERGEDYYQCGAVGRLQRRGNTLQAEVEGSEVEPYVVCLAFDDSGVTGVTYADVITRCGRFCAARCETGNPAGTTIRFKGKNGTPAAPDRLAGRTRRFVRHEPGSPAPGLGRSAAPAGVARPYYGTGCLGPGSLGFRRRPGANPAEHSGSPATASGVFAFGQARAKPNNT